MASVPTPPGPRTNPSPLWASARFVLRVHGVGSNWQRDVEVRRPFALIGRIPGSDVTIDDRAVSSRHTYLHLDRRGLFAVDLATRSGSRIGPENRAAAWLVPGDSLEVADRRIELLALELDGSEPIAPAPDDPLADSAGRPLVRVTLFPSRSPEAPLVLNSELVFLGRSHSCGVQVEEPTAARIQCVLVRTERAAYVVDLLGRATWLNGRPLREATVLHDGDILALGGSRFECRVQPFDPSATLPARTTAAAPPVPATATATELLPDLPIPPLPPELAGLEEQGQVLAWMMGVLQATQGEMLRRQTEFQRDVVQVLRQMQSDNADALSKHLERVEGLHHELSSLRDEVRRRFGPTAAPSRPEPPKVPPLRVAPATPTDDPEAAAAWLINRVSQIDQENRNSCAICSAASAAAASKPPGSPSTPAAPGSPRTSRSPRMPVSPTQPAPTPWRASQGP